MPLIISDGEAKTFQLQAEGYHKRPRHWAGGKFIDCTGASCALCLAGVRQTESWAIPISIGGIAEEWIFPQGVAQQLDTFTQQGHKLLGLVVKVSRTGTGTNTRYQVTIPGGGAPFVTPTPQAPPGQVAPAIAQAQARVVLPDGQSIQTADQWARLMIRLINRKDFLDVVASEVQAMKDEGLWR